MSSITLAIPPDVVRDARAYASRNGTSLNGMVRDYLADLVHPQGNADALADEFARLAAEHAVRRPRPYRFRRADAYPGEPLA
jgi:hypothetical protein